MSGVRGAGSPVVFTPPNIDKKGVNARSSQVKITSSVLFFRSTSFFNSLHQKGFHEMKQKDLSETKSDKTGTIGRGKCAFSLSTFHHFSNTFFPTPQAPWGTKEILEEISEASTQKKCSYSFLFTFVILLSHNKYSVMFLSAP